MAVNPLGVKRQLSRALSQFVGDELEMQRRCSSPLATSEEEVEDDVVSKEDESTETMPQVEDPRRRTAVWAVTSVLLIGVGAWLAYGTGYRAGSRRGESCSSSWSGRVIDERILGLGPEELNTITSLTLQVPESVTIHKKVMGYVKSADEIQFQTLKETVRVNSQGTFIQDGSFVWNVTKGRAHTTDFARVYDDDDLLGLADEQDTLTSPPSSFTSWIASSTRPSSALSELTTASAFRRPTRTRPSRSPRAEPGFRTAEPPGASFPPTKMPSDSRSISISISRALS